jgi:hypothetical protein
MRPTPIPEAPPRRAAIIDFAPIEPIEIDLGRVEILLRTRGPDAEIEVADMLGQVRRFYGLCRWEATEGERIGLARAAEQLRALAALLGLVSLERAAAGVLDCVTRFDDRALPACTARLLRLGDASERAGWPLETLAPDQGMPG